MGVFLLFFGGFFFLVFSCHPSPKVVFLEALAEVIMQRKEGVLQMQRILLAHGEAATKNGNKSILPSWLQLDPDSL